VATKAEPHAPAKAEAHPTPKPEAHGAAAAETWYVQIIATQNPATADDVARKLKAAGYASDVSPVPGKEGLFRVRIGPYSGRPAAETALGEVKLEKWLKATPMLVPAGK
jgi:cell division septation protein DedD